MSNSAVPVAVEAVTFQVDLLHLLIRHAATSEILAAIEATRDRQPFRRSRTRNQVDDRFVVSKRFTAPVPRDEREESVLDFVPFAGARREVADRQGEAGGVGQCLEFDLSQPETGPVAAPGVGGDRERCRVGIQMVPPRRATTLGRRRRQTRPCRGPYRSFQTRRCGPNLEVDPGHGRTRKVVAVHVDGIARRAPLLAGILIRAHEFFLLGIDRDDRQARGGAFFTVALMWRNCAFRSGWSSPSSVLRLPWRL